MARNGESGEYGDKKERVRRERGWMPGGRLTAVLLFDVRTQRANRSPIPRDFINAESSEVGCARHSSPNCAQLAFLLPNNYVCVYIYIYIVTVAIKRHYYTWLEGQSGPVERIKFLVKSFSSRSLLLRMRLRSLNSRGKYVKSYEVHSDREIIAELFSRR